MARHLVVRNAGDPRAAGDHRGAILLGSLLLRLTGVAAHGSTSFLAVAVLAVLILAALLPVLDHWWVVIVVPALSMLCYAGSWWLTTTYTDRPR